MKKTYAVLAIILTIVIILTAWGFGEYSRVESRILSLEFFIREHRETAFFILRGVDEIKTAMAGRGTLTPAAFVSLISVLDTLEKAMDQLVVANTLLKEVKISQERIISIEFPAIVYEIHQKADKIERHLEEARLYMKNAVSKMNEITNPNLPTTY